MKSILRLNMNAGDGVGIERSTDEGKTWQDVGYINTGATGSPLEVGRELVDVYNNFPDILDTLSELAKAARNQASVTGKESVTLGMVRRRAESLLERLAQEREKN